MTDHNRRTWSVSWGVEVQVESLLAAERCEEQAGQWPSRIHKSFFSYYPRGTIVEDLKCMDDGIGSLGNVCLDLSSEGLLVFLSPSSQFYNH